MIVRSTPSCITWEDTTTNMKIDFYGEWTLEPKFYLDVPKVAFWYNENSKKIVTSTELKEVLQQLLVESNSRGWIIELANCT